MKVSCDTSHTVVIYSITYIPTLEIPVKAVSMEIDNVSKFITIFGFPKWNKFDELDLPRDWYHDGYL